MDANCCKYAYGSWNAYDLDGIRQFVKFCHAYAVLENHRCYSVLDVGAGSGDFGKMLKRNNKACLYHALDMTTDRLGSTRDYPDSARFIKQDLREGLGSETLSKYDLVLLMDSLQNLDRETGIDLLRSVKNVSIGGHVCVSTRNSLMEPISDKDHHTYRWDLYELESLLQSMGFRVLGKFGVNLGYSEKDVSGSGSLYSFLPIRVYRTLAGLDSPEKCTYVMMDLSSC